MAVTEGTKRSTREIPPLYCSYPLFLCSTSTTDSLIPSLSTFLSRLSLPLPLPFPSGYARICFVLTRAIASPRKGCQEVKRDANWPIIIGRIAETNRAALSKEILATRIYSTSKKKKKSNKTLYEILFKVSCVRTVRFTGSNFVIRCIYIIGNKSTYLKG